ncbi:putative phospholipid ABC transporter permease protein mlaE [Blastochloris viridis]|uniref:Putative phospholipid ABC transporter permease protein mlaE n=1 Tax=Blastochloris viridis TaxID=1079 RepID=A0A0S4Q064_BLAVI|nr:putative phospholipid ABC transporter permease protein mlaE [Blastochloris viridis]
MQSTIRGRSLVIEAGGTWTSARAAELEKLVEAVGEEAAAVDNVELRLARIERLDTYGAWLIERLLRQERGKSTEIRMVGLDPRFDALIASMHEANRREPPPVLPSNGIRWFVEITGAAVVGIARDFVQITEFLGETMAAAGRALRRPAQFRPIAIVHQIDRAGIGAVPIIMLMTFLIGAIVAQQGIFHFRKFGAETYVVDMIGILTLRELAVLLVAIMLAGRSGSAYTAELGSMRMREETDALRVMGLDPIEVLVLPRLIALIIVMPLLTFIGAISALTGGGMVTWLYGGMSPDVYLDRLREAISLSTFQVGLIKAPFMALVIGLIACVEGFRVQGSAESLGLRTTASVVKAIFMVMVLDGLFAMFFAAVDM